MKPFLFVVCSPRSGSTLLRAMINSHPGIAIPPESHFLVPLLNGQLSKHTPDHQILERVLDVLSRHPRFLLWKLSSGQIMDSIRVPPTTVSDAVRCIYQAYALAHRKIQYGDKTPGYALNIPLLSRAFPESVFIHLVRDARDVALSLRSTPFGPSEIEQCAEFWLKRVKAACEAGEHLGNRYLMVRYEDIVSNPDQQLRTICSFAGLEYDPAVLDYQKEVTSIIASTTEPKIHSKLHQSLHMARNWRIELTSNEVKSIELVAGRMLDRLGYPLMD